MSQIRKAHSVEIIDKRLLTAESADSVDAMELVGLHDELARVERKWRLKQERISRGEIGDRPLADGKAIDLRFERLGRLIAASLRRDVPVPAERELLTRIADELRVRQPLVAP